MALGYNQVRQIIGRNSGATATTPAAGGAALDQVGQYAMMELAIAPPYLLTATLLPDRRRILLTFSAPVWSLLSPAGTLDQTGEPLDVVSATGSTITIEHPIPLGPGAYTMTLFGAAAGDGNYSVTTNANPTVAVGPVTVSDAPAGSGAVRESQLFRRRTRRGA